MLGRVAFLLTSVVLVAAACDDGWHHHHGYGYYYGGYGCARLSSCGSCTAALGCGWCYVSSTQQGTCVGDPFQCPGSAFSFTWDPAGCSSAVADSGKEPADAGEKDAAGDHAGGAASD